MVSRLLNKKVIIVLLLILVGLFINYFTKVKNKKIINCCGFNISTNNEIYLEDECWNNFQGYGYYLIILRPNDKTWKAINLKINNLDYNNLSKIMVLDTKKKNYVFNPDKYIFYKEEIIENEKSVCIIDIKNRRVYVYKNIG